MKMDLGHFRKVSEDQHTATLQHPMGHKITIAKKSLSPKLKKQLGGLPMKMVHGGEVSSLPDQQNSSQIPSELDQIKNEVSQTPAQPEQPEQPSVPVFDSASHTQVFPGDSRYEQVAAQNSAPQEPQEQPKLPENYPIAARQPASPGGIPNADMYGQMSKDLGQFKSGVQQEAQAVGQQGQLEQKAASDYNAQIQSVHNDTMSKWKDLQSHYDAALQDVKDSHINPSHYMESRSAVGKVSTAIGLILGGLGSGLTGGPNMALEFLNKQIDRDVQAQKDSLGKKETVLSGYYKQFGNLADAEKMTMATQQGLYASKLAQSAAQMKDPIAKAKAQQMAAEWDLKARKEMAPLALQASISQHLSSGKVDPGLVVRAMVPEHQQEQAFKELQAAQNHQKQSQVILNSFDQSNQQNTLGNRALHAGYEPAPVANLKTAMMPYLKDAEGRINEQELQRTDALIPAPGDSAYKIAQKRQGLINFMEEKSATPILDAYGIRLPKSVATPNKNVTQGYGVANGTRPR